MVMCSCWFHYRDSINMFLLCKRKIRGKFKVEKKKSSWASSHILRYLLPLRKGDFYLTVQVITMVETHLSSIFFLSACIFLFPSSEKQQQLWSCAHFSDHLGEIGWSGINRHRPGMSARAPSPHHPSEFIHISVGPPHISPYKRQTEEPQVGVGVSKKAAWHW